jgi:3-oxoacyl-[acyl-carrier-protein] synthase-1
LPNSEIFLLGGCISNDANHMSGPSRSGDGLFIAMQGAVKDAAMEMRDIDCVNLHGTATLYNDEMEAKAMALAGLQHLPTNSLKPYFGHTLAASGVAETVICAEQLRLNTVFATPQYKQCGTSIPLNINARHCNFSSLDVCLKTASGFGGCNAAIVLSKRKYQTSATNSISLKIKHIRSCSIKDRQIEIDGQTVFSSTDCDFDTFVRQAYKWTEDNYPKFYKMDSQCKLGYLAAVCLLRGIDFLPEETGIVLQNRVSSLDTDLRFQQQIANGDAGASPAVFVYTLPNIAAGEICIRFSIKGENTFFISEQFEEERLRNYVEMVMQDTELKYCIWGWCQFINGKEYASLRLVKKEQQKTELSEE